MVDAQWVKDILDVPTSSTITKCKNCDQLVPITSFGGLHIIHCESRISKCITCHKPFRISDLKTHHHCPDCGMGYTGELSTHLSDWHMLVKCHCGIDVERSKLQDHRKTYCVNRLILCRYCKCLFPVGISEGMDAKDKYHGLSSHEAICGNRTEICEICQQRIRIKDLDLHIQVFHQDM